MHTHTYLQDLEIHIKLSHIMLKTFAFLKT